MKRLLPLISLALLLAYPSGAVAYDNLNDRTFGDTPYTSASIFTATTEVFDNSAYTLESTEASAPPRWLSCADKWGSKTAWVRFRTAVAGRLSVTVDSSIPGPGGHDVFYDVYQADDAIPAGQVGFGDLTDVDCMSERTGPDETYSFQGGYAITANHWIYIQAHSVCQVAPDPPYCTAQEQADAPDGPMTINVKFTPDDADEDTAPDTLDNCPSSSNAAQGDEDGDGVGDVCDPDIDGDGRENAADNCPVAPNGDQEDLDADGVGDPCDTDRDGDGDPDETDCADEDADIHNDAKEERGDRVDENCDGKKAPYRFLKNGIRFQTISTENLRFLTWNWFKVLNVKKGMRIRIECDDRGAGCPYPDKTYKVKRSAGAKRVGEEFGKRFRELDQDQVQIKKVTILIKRRNFVGRWFELKVRRRGEPDISKGCIPKPYKFQPLRDRCRGIGGR